VYALKKPLGLDIRRIDAPWAYSLLFKTGPEKEKMITTLDGLLFACPHFSVPIFPKVSTSLESLKTGRVKREGGANNEMSKNKAQVLIHSRFGLI